MTEFQCFMDEVILLGEGGSFKPIPRKDVTPVDKYGHEEDSVPYFYGVYGDKTDNYTEKTGLIKGSTGLLMSCLAYVETDPEKKALLEKGVLPDRSYADIHTVPVRDGNASIPVGMIGAIYDDLNFETGTFELIKDKALWYGAAVPHTLIEDIHKRQMQYITYTKTMAIKETLGALNLKNGLVEYSVYQETEKDDTNVTLNFGQIMYEGAFQYRGVYDRTAKTGINATSLGSSIAMAKRSFAAGSSNLVTLEAEKGFVTGCDNIVDGKQAFAGGYANYAGGESSAAFGSCNQVFGKSAFVMGGDNIVSGEFATAIGYKNIVANQLSFVGGSRNLVEGIGCFVVGQNNMSANLNNTGHYTFMAGQNNRVDGYFNTVFGQNNICGNAAFVQFMAGLNLIQSQHTAQATFGAFNKTDNEAQFIVGAGDSETTRRNVFSTGFSVDGESYIQIEDIRLTKAQLQRLLNLLK